MPHKLKQLFMLILLMGVNNNGALFAQILREFSLPIGPNYTFTEYSKPTKGYTFIGSYRFSPAANFPSTLLIIDEDGAPAFVRERLLGQGIMADFRIYNNGLMSYYRYDELLDKGQYMVMDSTFAIIDSVECAMGLQTDGHDMIMLENGNFLILCLEEKIMDLSSLQTDDGFMGLTIATVVAPVIQELDANRNVLFGWHGAQYYTLADVNSYFFLDPEYLDMGHANSLSVDLDGNILMSLRFFNEVTKINYADSSIMWRLGGKSNDFTFINETQPFSTQHHCRVLPNGNITLYDNSELGNPPRPRGVEYQLNTTNMTATNIWEYAYDTIRYSYSLGSMDRIDTDSNSIINWGAGYTPGFDNDIVEVSPSGNLVTAFDWPQDYFAYRAYKRTPIWNLEALRPTITCDTTEGVTKLTAKAGFGSYLWNTGDTTETIVVSQVGEYYVMVNNFDDRGYFGSRLKKITNLTTPCFVPDTIVDTIIDTSTSIVPLMLNEQFSLYPNPAERSLTLANYGHTGHEQVVFYNALGAVVYTQPLTVEGSQISVTELPNGSYIGLITTTDGRPIQRFKFLVMH